jgi:hypothetical protein
MIILTVCLLGGQKEYRERGREREREREREEGGGRTGKMMGSRA